MSDTLINIPIPKNTWVNLYGESEISVGTPLEVDNVGDSDIRLTVSDTQPSKDYDGYNLLANRSSFRLRNTIGDSGAWAYSGQSAGKVNVRAL